MTDVLALLMAVAAVVWSVGLFRDITAAGSRRG